MNNVRLPQESALDRGNRPGGGFRRELHLLALLWCLCAIPLQAQRQSITLAPELEPLEATTGSLDGDLIALVVSSVEPGNRDAGNRLDAFLVPLDDPAGMQRQQVQTSPVVFSLGREIQEIGTRLMTAGVDDFEAVVWHSQNGLHWTRIDVAPGTTCLEVELIRVGDRAALSCYDYDRGRIRIWTAADGSLRFVEGPPILAPAGHAILPAFYGGERHATVATSEQGFVLSLTTTSTAVDPGEDLTRWIYQLEWTGELASVREPFQTGSRVGPGEGFDSKGRTETSLMSGFEVLEQATEVITIPALQLPEIVDPLLLPAIRAAIRQLLWEFDGDRNGPARVVATDIDLDAKTAEKVDVGCPKTTGPGTGVSGASVLDFFLYVDIFGIRSSDPDDLEPLQQLDPPVLCDEEKVTVDGVVHELSPFLSIAAADTIVDSGSSGAAAWAPRAPGSGRALAAASTGSTLLRMHRLLLATRDDGGLHLVRFTPRCVPDATSLCLRDGRFRAQVLWRDPQGNLGVGNASSITDEAGTFWFFDPDNVEIAFKLLDGRVFNQSFWTFYGSLTDVEFWLFVTDNETGYVRVFHNPAGSLASVADVEAFPGSSEFAIGDVEQDSSARVFAAVSAEPPIQYRFRRQRSSAGAESCASDPTKLCLNGGRFAVAVEWSTAAGDSGVATPTALTDDSAYFWFFEQSNVEIVLKVLDARVINGQFWVFFASLSDVRFTVTITDLATGQSKVYENPQGRLASVADTSAFPGG